jgi:hypothetical protein
MTKANGRVVRERVSELAAGLTPNVVENTGSSGCTAYIRAKVARPAANKARLVRQKRAVPRAIGSNPMGADRENRPPGATPQAVRAFL